jgi:hypothetical protein
MSRLSSVRFRPLQRGRSHAAGPSSQDGVPRLKNGCGSKARWQAACRTSARRWPSRLAATVRLPLKRRRRRTRPVPGRGPFKSVERLPTRWRSGNAGAR